MSGLNIEKDVVSDSEVIDRVKLNVKLVLVRRSTRVRSKPSRLVCDV